MKVIKYILAAMIIATVMGVFLSRIHASTLGWKCSCCQTGSCKDAIVYQGQTLTVPRPKGCNKKVFSDGCKDDCFRCDGTTATEYCKFDSTSSDKECYWQQLGLVTCGTEDKYGCEGVWSEYCSCPSTGGGDTSEPCKLKECNGDFDYCN